MRQLFGGALRDRDSAVAVDRRLNAPRSNSPSLGRGWRVVVSGKTEVIRGRREERGFSTLVENSKEVEMMGEESIEFRIPPDSRFYRHPREEDSGKWIR